MPISIFERVRATVVDQIGVSAGDVMGHTRLIADLHLDSLDNVELWLALEADFNIEVPEKDWEKLFVDRADPTIDQLTALVSAYAKS